METIRTSIRQILSDPGRSSFQKYKDLTVGEKGNVGFLVYEISSALLGPIPGALGILLRQKIYPNFFRRCGRGLIIGRNCTFRHPSKMSFGDNVTIGLRTSIFTHMYWGKRRSEGGYKEVVIEKDVFIGPHCLILPGVHVGEGAVVKGGSVLTRNVPARVFLGSAEPTAIAEVKIPLTAEYSYEEFVRGLRPLRKMKTK